MNAGDALAVLRRLAASGSHVMVTAHVNDSPVALFDSPVPAADAIIAVESIDRTMAVTYTVRRDETGLGVTH